jgi:hypothetical protein
MFAGPVFTNWVGWVAIGWAGGGVLEVATVGAGGGVGAAATVTADWQTDDPGLAVDWPVNDELLFVEVPLVVEVLFVEVSLADGVVVLIEVSVAGEGVILVEEVSSVRDVGVLPTELLPLVEEGTVVVFAEAVLVVLDPVLNESVALTV